MSKAADVARSRVDGGDRRSVLIMAAVHVLVRGFSPAFGAFQPSDGRPRVKAAVQWALDVEAEVDRRLAEEVR
jgi:hypothetical protein